MSASSSSKAVHRGFCIYIDTLCQGQTVAVRDGGNWPVVFATEREAQLEMVDFLQTRLQEFLDGDRDFEDAITVGEYVVPVTVLDSGAVVDECGREYNNEM
ncbi:MAG: hypothetical protein ABII82_18360 [Verrucomicrobiota bacterium]